MKSFRKINRIKPSYKDYFEINVDIGSYTKKRTSSRMALMMHEFVHHDYNNAPIKIGYKNENT